MGIVLSSAVQNDTEQALTADHLIEKVLAYNPDADIGAMRQAFELASEAHAGQVRDNGDPYLTHPLAVADILADFHLDVPSIMTGFLHDTIEDTGLSQEELANRFGKTVADLVDGVTKLTRLELQSEKTKQAENFRKLVLAMSRDIRVLLIKLADRLHNMRTLSFVQDRERRHRIAHETMDIYAPLAERIGMNRVKIELQDLAFAELEPEANTTIRARLNYLRGQGADVIDTVDRELTQLCQSVGIKNAEVRGREKSPFSIWGKMQRRNVAFEQLSDIMAFRILVPTREDCYTVLGAVHSAYPVISGRFKDYISTPKVNGYQSLHTGVTLRQPRNQKIEVQIRTPQMHEVAEYGVAAHWAYKQALGQSEADRAEDFIAIGKKLRWVQDLLEILENSQAPDEFLENTKLELYQDQVFCFTPKGQLISLPSGATPIDFAYAVHSQVGDRCVGAKVNGRLMPLKYQLKNGDQVEIMTARGGTPSPSWERFVVTGKARARIRRYVAQQQRETYIDSGRVALAKAFRQEGVDGSEKVLEGALKGLKQATVNDLYINVGSGNIGSKEVVHTIYPELRNSGKVPRIALGLLTRSGGESPKKAIKSGVGTVLTGIGAGVGVRFAGCCHPLPGDPVVGVVSTGKAITIHHSQCRSLLPLSNNPERLIPVGWDYGVIEKSISGQLFNGRVRVISANIPTALAEITNMVVRHNGAILNIRVLHRQVDFMEILVDVEIRDLKQLITIISALRSIPQILQVDRIQG